MIPVLNVFDNYSFFSSKFSLMHCVLYVFDDYSFFSFKFSLMRCVLYARMNLDFPPCLFLFTFILYR